MKKLDIEKIKNPIVRKALSKRCADFIFSYGDEESTSHTDELARDSPRRYNDAWKNKYDDHSDYSESNYSRKHRDYSDYEESWLHTESDRTLHSDYYSGDSNDPSYDDWHTVGDGHVKDR